MSFDLADYSSRLVKSLPFYAPQGLKREPLRGEHPLKINYGEYPPGLTRKEGGILVMISFSPLIFLTPFCGLWKINVKYEAAQTSSQGCTLLGGAR